MVHNLADFFTALTSAFVRQVVLGFGLLALLGVVLSLQQRWIFIHLFRAIGLRGVVLWTGWLGTPIHELSHLVLCFLFRVEVTQFKLWEPDPQNGTLGFVRYRVPELKPSHLHKVIGTFVMGVGPLFGGSLFLLALLHLLTPDAAPVLAAGARFADLVEAAPPDAVVRGFAALVKTVYLTVFADGAASWRPWVFLYAAMCVGAHLAPSRPDLTGGLVGLLVLLGLALFLDAVALLVGWRPANAADAIARLTGPLAVLLLLAAVLNCGNLLVALALSAVLGRRR